MWGSHVKAFEERIKKTGEIPGPMKNRPRLKNEDVAYYTAFNHLSSARPSGGMGVAAAIPVSEVLAFCELVGIAIREERVKYLDLVQELDQICLEHWAKEASKKSPKK